MFEVVRCGRVEITLDEEGSEPPISPDLPSGEIELNAGESDRRYKPLLGIMEILAGERSIPEILAAVIRLAVSAVEADRGFILLYDPDTGRWLPDSVSGWQSGEEDEELSSEWPSPFLRLNDAALWSFC